MENTNVKYKTTCPLINNRKSLKIIKLESKVYGIGIMEYNNNEFIIVGTSDKKLKIYNMDLDIIVEYDLINANGCIRYLSHLKNEIFVVVCKNVNIFVLYENKTSPESGKNLNNYSIQLVQSFEVNKYGNLLKPFNCNKVFLFNRNIKKNEENKNEELIISSSLGIDIYTKNQEKEIKNYNSINNDNYNIENELEKWKNNKYNHCSKLDYINHYDLIQVNSKYLAGVKKKYLCIYSMNTYELVTKFEATVTVGCDYILFMLTEDLICLGGKDSISLLSIKEFDIVLVSVIEPEYKITEICILPDFNILIGMSNGDDDDYFNSKKLEYFYQYKYFYQMNEKTKKMEHQIIKMDSKLLTSKKSNVRMRCLSDNRLLINVDLYYLQIWK